MRTPALLLIGLLGLTPFPRLTLAQTSTADLQSGQTVRLWMADSVVEGEIIAARPDGLTVRTDTSDLAIAWTDVDHVNVLAVEDKGPETLLIGAAVGAMVGGLVKNFTQCFWGCDSELHAFLEGSAIGGVFGMTAGALVSQTRTARRWMPVVKPASAPDGTAWRLGFAMRVR